MVFLACWGVRGGGAVGGCRQKPNNVRGCDIHQILDECGEAADNLVEHHYPPIGPNILSKLPMYSRALPASKEKTTVVFWDRNLEVKSQLYCPIYLVYIPTDFCCIYHSTNTSGNLPLLCPKVRKTKMLTKVNPLKKG